MRLPTAPGLIALAVLVGACDHSAPFTGSRAGADGPMPGQDPRFLTIDSVADPAWSYDEAAILYRLPRRPPLSPPDPPGWTVVPIGQETSTCLALLPANGGSALWQRCEWAPEFEGRIGITHSAAAGPNGRVVFIRRDKPRGNFFPVGSRIDLMVIDTTTGQQARLLETLYRDANGQLLNPPGSVNWLTDLGFLDAERLMARAWHLRPNGNTQSLGWRIGILANDTVSWQAIPTPLEGGRPAVADNGQALLWWRGDGALALATPAGVVVATGSIPTRGGTPDLAGLRCHRMACIALTRAPFDPDFEQITGWRVTLPTLATDSVAAFLLSPGDPVTPAARRGSVISQGSGRRLVLLRDLLPTLP
jgi:hypothetical protein